MTTGGAPIGQETGGIPISSFIEGIVFSPPYNFFGGTPSVQNFVL